MYDTWQFVEDAILHIINILESINSFLKLQLLVVFTILLYKLFLTTLLNT